MRARSAPSAGPRVEKKNPHCTKTYIPYLVEKCLSKRRSPELLPFQKDGWHGADKREPKDVVFVRQSEGGASADKALVSIGFQQCSAVIVRNIDTGESLMIHHDSSVRSNWPPYAWEVLGEPASPCTPTRGLLMRDRCNYAAFMAKPGRKEAILVESERSYDRREVMDQIAADGATILPTLTIKTQAAGTEQDQACWEIIHRPDSADVIIHLKDSAARKVLHFSGIFSTDAQAAAARPVESKDMPDKDLVARLDEYRARVREARELPETVRETLQVCLAVVEFRNFRPGMANAALKHITQTPGLPAHLIEKLQGRLALDRDRTAVLTLTELMDHLLDTPPVDPVDFDV